MRHRFCIADRERLHVVKQYVDQHLHEPLRLEELCAMALMNRHKLNEGFQKYYDKKARAYILEQRMQKARKLLLESDLSLAEIAETIGYEHANNFSTAYQKFYGHAPSKERQLNSL